MSLMEVMDLLQVGLKQLKVLYNDYLNERFYKNQTSTTLKSIII